MDLLRKIKANYIHIRLLLWVKWMIKTEDIRMKMEKFVYKMEGKLKSK